MLIGGGDLNTVGWSARILAHGAFASHVAEIPNSVFTASDNVVVLGGLSDKSEGLVLASEEEAGLIASINEITVIGTGNWGWDTAVDSWASGRGTGEPVFRLSRQRVVNALSESGSHGSSERFAHLVTRQGDVASEC